MIIDGDFQIGDVSGGNGSMNSHILSQQVWDLNHCDVICGNGFINIHTLYQFNESSLFNDTDGDFENGGVSGRHGAIKRHSLS